MTDETPKDSRRMLLGPVATAHLRTLPDQTPAMFDKELKRLLAVDAKHKDTEEPSTPSIVDLNPLIEAIRLQTRALNSSNKSFDALSNLVKYRLAEIEKLMIYFTTLVSKYFHEDVETTVIHDRLQKVQTNLHIELDNLTHHLDQLGIQRAKTIEHALVRTDEERLAVPQPRQEQTKGAVQRGGMER